MFILLRYSTQLTNDVISTGFKFKLIEAKLDNSERAESVLDYTKLYTPNYNLDNLKQLDAAATPRAHFHDMILIALFIASVITGTLPDPRLSSCTHVRNMNPRGGSTIHTSAEGYRRLYRGRGGSDEFSRFTSSSKITSLGLHETVCYDYLEPNAVERTQLYIEFLEMEEVYPIVEHYNFSLPVVDTKCWCDCPGGPDHCNSGKHECQEPCISWFRSDQDTAGCSVTLGRSQLCCTAEMKPRFSKFHTNKSLIFTAVKLGSPIQIATISQQAFNTSDGESLHKDVRKINLEQQHTLDDMTRLALHLDVQPVRNRILEDSWYFMTTDHPGLYTGSVINDLDEWDPRKLGWFRPDRDGYRFDAARLAQEMNGEVLHCGKQQIDKFSFGALYTNDEFPADAYDLNQDLQREGYYELQENAVVVKKSVAPRISLTMTINENLDILFRANNGKVRNCVATVTMTADKSSVFLALTLMNAVGTLEGRYISGTKGDRHEETFSLFLPEEEEEIEKELSLNQPCREKTRVRIRPTQIRAAKIFNWVECPVECTTDIEIYRSEPKAIVVFLPKKLPSWQALTSPGEWFNGIDSTFELVMMLTILGCSIIIVSVVLKLGLKLLRGL